MPGPWTIQCLTSKFLPSKLLLSKWLPSGVWTAGTQNRPFVVSTAAGTLMMGPA
ncbi:MAG: hypothetical protein HKN47_04745 [Pirellulaceae bacterium]|nr:hypothetical protein [Pirellulaceae bacterium]